MKVSAVSRTIFFTSSSASGDAVSVGGPTASYALGTLDPRKPIAGGYSLVRINRDALRQNAVLREIRLSDTLCETG